LLIVLLGVIEWRRNSKSRTPASTDRTITLPAMIESSKSSATGTGWTLRSLINRRRQIRAADEERRGHEIMEGLKRHIPPKGVARIWAILSLFLVLTVPSFLAGWYAHGAYQNNLRDRYDWVRVLQRYNDWDYQMQFVEGGPPFTKIFCHDGSENKLDLDPGMTLEYMIFVEHKDCTSVAAKNLGIKVHRDRVTGKFVDWRAQ
jgi:hypothetical protein